MAYRITKNIKVGMVLADGELVFEFRRPTNEERNLFLHEQLQNKSAGVEQLNDNSRTLVAMYDQFIDDTYVENGKGREPLVGEDEQVLGPKDLPEDIKAKAAGEAFAFTSLNVKNF